MIRVFADLIVKDKRGRITRKKTIECKSFVRQFLELLFVQFGQTETSVKDTNGTSRTPRPYTYTFKANAPSGNTSYGILVGTGTTSPTISDYKMESLINHGSGGGQLQYGAVTFGDPTCDATTCYFTITRDFSNGSGGDITVHEIGLAVMAYDSGSKYFLAIRDVVSGGISVPNGQTLTLNYRIKVTA